MRDVLIIDGQNLFIRSYCAYPQLTSEGEQAGGMVGFLKSMAVICRQYYPGRVYVVWEGGGSSRRRKIYPDYKANRRPEKLNRFYEDDIPDTEDNKSKQLIALVHLLRHTPVCQVYVPDCEGDDVISYMCRGPLRGVDKLIVSSDKDMLQLLDEKTRVYSPHKKKIIEARDVFEEYRISPDNFAIAKCLCGDPTDNVPGIKGLGFKTVAKRFPILSGEPVLLQDVINYASTHSDESIAYRRVVERVDDVRRNWQLVHLDGSMLSHDHLLVRPPLRSISPEMLQ
jgi:DNA polymerase-1